MTAGRACGFAGRALGLAALLAPSGAAAQTAAAEGFATGLLQFTWTPALLLLLLALSLWTGSFPMRRYISLGIGFFLAFWLAVLVAPPLAQAEFVTLAVALAAALAAAAIPGRIWPLAVALSLAGGASFGLSTSDFDGTITARVMALIGAALTANLGLYYLATLTQTLRARFQQDWCAIGLRIAAAWVGAVSLLMFALRFAPAA